MFYSLFYCSLLLALFPLFGSSTIRSSLRCHTLLTAPLHASCHPLTLRKLFQPSLLISPPHAPRHPLTLRRLFHHSLLIAPPHAPHHSPILCRLFQPSLLIAPPHAPRHPSMLRRLFQISLLTAPPLAPHYAVTRSSSPSHAPQALPILALLRATARSVLRNHSLLVTLSRSKIPLNTPCFVTRKTMAEGAKKHDDFRLPT